MFRTWCALLAPLAPLALASLACGAELQTLRPRQLAVGQQFDIATQDRLYRGELVDYKTGKCLLKASADGGASFSRPRVVYLLGATRDRQEGLLFVIMGEAKVGLRLELAVDDLEPEHRFITTPITHLLVHENDPNAA